MSAPAPEGGTETNTTRKRGTFRGLAIAFLLLIILVDLSLLPNRLQLWLPSRPNAGVAEVAVPADMLVGGVEPLSAGSWLDLYASLPNAQSTPQPLTLTGLRVATLVGESSVLLAVSPKAAPTLQAAILVEDARFAYHLLAGTPTATPPSGEAPTATPRPTPTGVPGAGLSYLHLGTDKLDLSTSWLAKGPAQLVIVEKLELPPLVVQGQADCPVAALSVHDVTTATVTVVDFLDKDGARQPAVDGDTTTVLIQLAAGQWAELARHLAGAETMWLIHWSEE